MEKSNWKNSMKVKILASVLPTVAIMVMILVGVSYYVSSNMIRELAEENLSTSAKGQEKEIEAWLDENLVAVDNLKLALESGDLDEEQEQKILDGFYNANSSFVSGAYIGGTDGSFVKSTYSDKIESDVTNSQWFKEGMTRVSMDYGNMYTNENGENVISATGILKSDDDTVRVLGVDVTLDRISIIVNSNVEMDNAASFLVDTKSNEILSHRDLLLAGTTFSTGDSDPLLAAIAEKISEADYTTAQLADNEVVFKEIQNTNWVLVSYVPVDSVLSSVRTLRTALLLIGIICALVVLLIIERSIHFTVKPIKKLTDVITTMSTGDFTVPVQVSGKSEISVMSGSVKEFMNSMKKIIQSIGKVSGELEEQAQSSQNAAEQMHSAAEQQAKSMEDLNQTVDDLVQSVTEIANNATTLAMVVSDTRDNGEKVTTKMHETVDATEKGKHDMEDVRCAMESISASMNKLEEVIHNVGVASGNITNIVEMISEIAGETNLLSLNASIEAARAGEAGRGFAVVASEIGSLAQNSANSANEIAKLIQEVQSLVGECVAQTSESVKHINESGEMIHTAVDTFDLIYDNITETDVLINQVMDKIMKVDSVASNVAAISEEQAASATLISETSEHMVDAANNILDNSSLVAKSSGQLADNAVVLDQNVKVFKIEKEEA